jgi:hypothetical protein
MAEEFKGGRIEFTEITEPLRQMGPSLGTNRPGLLMEQAANDKLLAEQALSQQGMDEIGLPRFTEAKLMRLWVDDEEKSVEYLVLGLWSPRQSCGSGREGPRGRGRKTRGC